MPVPTRLLLIHACGSSMTCLEHADSMAHCKMHYSPKHDVTRHQDIDLDMAYQEDIDQEKDKRDADNGVPGLSD